MKRSWLVSVGVVAAIVLAGCGGEQKPAAGAEGQQGPPDAKLQGNGQGPDANPSPGVGTATASPASSAAPGASSSVAEPTADEKQRAVDATHKSGPALPKGSSGAPQPNVPPTPAPPPAKK